MIIKLQLDTGALDYETISNYYINISTTDSGPSPELVTQTLHLSVIDQQEPPEVTVSLYYNKLSRNFDIGTVIGRLVSHDPDYNQTLTYYMFHTYMGILELNGLHIQVARTLDIIANENLNVTITIKATDNGKPPLSAYSHSYITWYASNHQPTNIILSNTSIYEYTSNGDITHLYGLQTCDETNYIQQDHNETITIGLIKVVDEDIGDSHVITVINTDNSNYNDVDPFWANDACHFEVDVENMLKVSS